VVADGRQSQRKQKDEKGNSIPDLTPVHLHDIIGNIIMTNGGHVLHIAKEARERIYQYAREINNRAI
jgi:hypothetical protein